MIKTVFNFKCIYRYACVTYYFFLCLILNIFMYLHGLHTNFNNGPFDKN